MPIRKLFFTTLLICVALMSSWANAEPPHIGYLYPAGGQQGTDIQITVGGQLLRGATKVYISGEGVEASVIEYMRPITNLNKEQRELIQSRLKEVKDKRLAELNGTSTGKVKNQDSKQVTDKPKDKKKESDAKAEEITMPKHPLLVDLEDKSLRELAHITSMIFAPRGKQQINRQIAESAIIRVKIDPDAKPGDRELRIETATGLSNPMVFQVGTLREVGELEPNDQQAYPNLPRMPELPKGKPLDLPVLLNGQIMPGDIDRFRFNAKKGQELVIEAHARSLIPYLADAVPGWFQATLTVYDAKGNEMAFADDYRFNPDPVLFYNIPEDGEYELEIRDSIYRGRQDFVYRISVGQLPFITHIFPLGGKEGSEVTASAGGWNLPESQLKLDTKPGADTVRKVTLQAGKNLSNQITYAVDNLPNCSETESNDSIKNAQQIKLPITINGRISKEGDLDVFSFKGHKGDKIVAQVEARQLNSSLDSLLRLTNVSSKVLEWNDDHEVKDEHLYKDAMGLLTHHADSYLTAELPEDGTYYIHLTDSQNHGGQAYGYRLHITPPQPDFALRVTPSSLRVLAGGIVPIRVHVLRSDGFDGKIEVKLKDTSSSFELNGNHIPAGCNRIDMTLTAPPTAPDQPIALQLQGVAEINGKTVSHDAVPSEDMMQAFLYRHLVPSQQLLVSVQKAKWRTPPVALGQNIPVQIPVGGEAKVLFKTRNRPMLAELILQLHQPPDWVSLHDTKVVAEGLSVTLRTDKDKAISGTTDNLMVEAIREYTPTQKDGKSTGRKRRTSMGFFPAVPVEIIAAKK